MMMTGAKEVNLRRVDSIRINHIVNHASISKILSDSIVIDHAVKV